MRILTILFSLVIGFASYADETVKNPVEIGDVQWRRDFDAALADNDFRFSGLAGVNR